LRVATGLAGFALVALGVLGSSGQSEARSSPVKVLIYSSVSDTARASMSPELWAKFVDSYAGAITVTFAGPDNPTVDDCRKAGADYMLVAPFDLRPRLPGMANSTGRVAATTHLIATNCITNTISLDQTLNFDSDPPSSASDGDFESVPEITWSRAIPATLAHYPLAFQRVAHIMQVNTPFAYVDIKSGGALRVGDPLRDFSTPDHKPRKTPIILTVTQIFDNYVEVTFTQSDDNPTGGDLVEPLVKRGT
jgi:hypothetical protein